MFSGGNELLNPAEILKRAGIGYRQRIADFGCGGLGFFTMPAARAVGNDGHVYAVDILKSSLVSVEGLAKQSGLPNITTLWSNIERYGATSIQDQSLDLGLLVNTLFQSRQWKDMLREAVRMVKPGGKLLVIDWKPGSSPFGPPANARLAPDAVRAATMQLGLRETQAFEAGPFHYGLLFRVP